MQILDTKAQVASEMTKSLLRKEAETPILRFFSKDGDLKLLEALTSKYVFRQQKGIEVEPGLWVNKFAPGTYSVQFCFGKEIWQEDPLKSLSHERGTCFKHFRRSCTKEIEQVIPSRVTPLGFVEYSLYWIINYYAGWDGSMPIEARDLILMDEKKLLDQGLKPKIPLPPSGLPEERIVWPTKAHDQSKSRSLGPRIHKEAYVRITAPTKLPEEFLPQSCSQIIEEHRKAAEMLSGLNAIGYALFSDAERIRKGVRYVHWFYNELIERAKSGQIPL